MFDNSSEHNARDWLDTNPDTSASKIRRILLRESRRLVVHAHQGLSNAVSDVMQQQSRHNGVQIDHTAAASRLGIEQYVIQFRIAVDNEQGDLSAP